MRRCVEIALAQPGIAGAVLLAPLPVAFWDQRFEGFEASGHSSKIQATNSAQRAYLIEPGSQAPRLRHEFSEAPGAGSATDVWQVPDNALTRASDDLAALAADPCPVQGAVADRLMGLIAHAGEVFDYDHPEERFNAGHAAVPTLCGTAKGSCIDINTFVLAVALSAGIPGQYVMGYWFGPGRFQTPDAHCWLVFDTPNGPVAIGHFGEPVWVLPGGATAHPELTITLTETALEDA